MNHIQFGVAFHFWQAQGLPQARRPQARRPQARHSRAGGNPEVWHAPGLRLVLLLIALLMSASFFRLPSSAFLVSDAYAGDVQYIYDDLGRLLAVVDATAGEAAIYQYDAVGNLLAIVRQPASTVAILNFTPKSGPIGTTVAFEAGPWALDGRWRLSGRNDPARTCPSVLR